MTEGGKTARSDLWGGAGWVGFGLLIVVESLRMERFGSQGAVLYTMPGFVPGLIGAAVALLGVVLMLRGWLRARQAAADAAASGGAEAEGVGASPPLFNARVLITLGFGVVYAGLLIGRMPFWLATALFVTAFVALFTPENASPTRRAVVAIAAGVLTAVIVTLVFEQVFLVRLP